MIQGTTRKVNRKQTLDEKCPRGLTNRILYANEVCEVCNCYLKKSNWRNVNVFESTNHSWITGFLCVRCSKISRKSFDRFVGKFVVKEVKKRLTQHCRKGRHEKCQLGDCGVCICECHGVGGVN